MKYTRYDIKKNNNDNLFIIAVFIFILILAFFVGTVISDVFIKKRVSTQPTKNDNTSNILKKNDKNNSTNFIVIQGGVYQKREISGCCKSYFKSIWQLFYCSGKW